MPHNKYCESENKSIMRNIVVIDNICPRVARKTN